MLRFAFLFLRLVMPFSRIYRFCFLAMAGLSQGEDVVAGIRTPQSIEKMKDVLPEAYKQLCLNCDLLEAHYKDMMVPSLFPANPFFK